MYSHNKVEEADTHHSKEDRLKVGEADSSTVVSHSTNERKHLVNRY